MLEQSVSTRLDAGGPQVVDITVRGGYWPAAIRARAGVPLRIIFHRDDQDTCTERVVFSAPRLERRLSPDGPTTIDLPAQPAGEIRFTCGMGRYRGRIDLVDGRVQSLMTRIRWRASQLEAPVGTALLLWICSLPLIALLGVVTLGATSALAITGAALLGWVVGCLWAFRGSSHAT